jgi:hypothetical protein
MIVNHCRLPYLEYCFILTSIMYCPKCLNDTLKLRSNGVVKISFNGKHRDNSLFTFNFAKETQLKMDKNFTQKVEEFLAWYSTFNNKNPIAVFEAYSSDFVCDNKCQIDVNTKISVIGPIFTTSFVVKTLKEQCTKYKIDCEINDKSFG